MLIGLVFWMPWLGLAIGAVSGAIAGKFKRYRHRRSLHQGGQRYDRAGPLGAVHARRAHVKDRVIAELAEAPAHPAAHESICGG